MESGRRPSLPLNSPRSQMDKVTFIAIFLANCWVLVGGTTVTPDSHMYDIGINDKLFTDNIIFESLATSVPECGAQCNQHDSCLTFTFYPNSCRGHNARMTSCFASVRMPEAKSYVKKSLGDPGGFCQESGVKRVTNASLELDLDVYCNDNWLVFQKRQDGSVDFYRNWQNYADGFGDVQGEYWLGLEALHRITSFGVKYELRVDVMAKNGRKGFVYYSNFSVGPDGDFYTLNFDCFLGGNTGDGLTWSHGVSFSTFDADHDGYDPRNRAVDCRGGWWYRWGQLSNLNGMHASTATSYVKSMFWVLHGRLRASRMMIRPAVDQNR